jgi:hypothetical protein
VTQSEQAWAEVHTPLDAQWAKAWAEVCVALEKAQSWSLYDLINLKDRITSLRETYGDPNVSSPCILSKESSMSSPFDNKFCEVCNQQATHQQLTRLIRTRPKQDPATKQWWSTYADPDPKDSTYRCDKHMITLSYEDSPEFTAWVEEQRALGNVIRVDKETA